MEVLEPGMVQGAGRLLGGGHPCGPATAEAMGVGHLGGEGYEGVPWEVKEGGVLVGYYHPHKIPCACITYAYLPVEIGQDGTRGSSLAGDPLLTTPLA